MSHLHVVRPLRPISLQRTTALQSCSFTGRSLTFRVQISVRGKSTKADPAKHAAKATASAAAQAVRGSGKVTELEKQTLPWADYLTIRKKKRRWETVRRACIADVSLY